MSDTKKALYFFCDKRTFKRSNMALKLYETNEKEISYVDTLLIYILDMNILNNFDAQMLRSCEFD